MMTNGELFEYLEKEARDYRVVVLESIARNCHMNELTQSDIKKLAKHQELAQRAADAVLIGFINQIAHPGDLGLHAKHINDNLKLKIITSEVMDVVEKCKKYVRSGKGKMEMNEILKKITEVNRKLKESRKISQKSLNQKMTT